MTPNPYQGSTIDHLNVTVTDVDRSLAIYVPALSVLGIEKLLDFTGGPDDDYVRMVGFGSGRKPFFWLVQGSTFDPALHVAFSAPTRDAVREFHAAALAAGARDKLSPRVCPEYHENYFGGFVYDPDGINVEAVCHLE